MKSILFALLFAALASADPITITWTGTPSISSSICPGCGDPNAEADVVSGTTATLSAASGTYAQYGGVYSEFTVDAQLMIPSAAQINLSATGNYDVNGESCPAIGCWGGMTTFDAYGQMQGSVEIEDESGDDLLTVLLSATEDTKIPCAGGCGVGVGLTDTESGSVFLDAGTYTVIASLSDSTDTGGDSMTGSGLRATFTDPVGVVSAVPEPRISVLWLAVGLVGIVWRRRRA